MNKGWKEEARKMGFFFFFEFCCCLFKSLEEPTAIGYDDTASGATPAPAAAEWATPPSSEKEAAAATANANRNREAAANTVGQQQKEAPQSANDDGDDGITRVAIALARGLSVVLCKKNLFC